MTGNAPEKMLSPYIVYMQLLVKNICIASVFVFGLALAALCFSLLVDLIVLQNILTGLSTAF